MKMRTEPRMAKNKASRPELKFHFHNPNSPDATVSLIINVFYEVQLPRAKKAIDKALEAMVESAHAAFDKEEKPPPETGWWFFT